MRKGRWAEEANVPVLAKCIAVVPPLREAFQREEEEEEEGKARPKRPHFHWMDGRGWKGRRGVVP